MKIKYLIDTLLSTNIQALDFVERYGGMVSTIHTKQDDFEANGKGTIKRYPVACDVNDIDCNNLSKYQDLVPNDEKLSVVYWEELSPMTNVGETATKSFYQKRFRGTGRLIVWANLAKLGSSSCNGDLMAMQLELERVISVKGKITGGLFNQSLIRIQPVKDVAQDINTVFGKYDYPKELNYYLYPFGFFALDVEFELDYCIANGASVPVNPPIDCYNSDLTACERILALLTPELTRTCVQPTIDYSVQENLDALSPTQVTDLQAAFCVPCPPLPSTCPEILAFIAPVRSTCVIPSLNFATGFDDDFDALDSTQIDDLETRICTPIPVLPRYSTTFDGLNESVASSYNALHELERTDPFTIDVRVKITSYTLGAIVGKFDYQGTRRGWVIWTINSGSVVFELASNESTGNTVTTITVAKIPLNTWTRITVTYTGNSNASGVLMYLDKVSTPYTIFQNALTGTTVDATNIIQVGGDAPAYFAGRIYEAMVYKNRVLTPAEIAALPTVTDTPQYESDLIYWNKLGQGSIFGETVRVYPDYTNIVSGFQSRNMEIGDLSTDIPT